MNLEDSYKYGIGYFMKGSYHILCKQGNKHKFDKVEDLSNIEPLLMDFHTARKFIDTHPICANLTHHQIRIMPFSEIRDILQGRFSTDNLKYLILGNEEEEYEEPLH